MNSPMLFQDEASWSSGAAIASNLGYLPYENPTVQHT